MYVCKYVNDFLLFFSFYCNHLELQENHIFNETMSQMKL